jgi:hypothetical protein
MNKAEKKLLESLKEKNENAPLENIRNTIGELRYFAGNPKFKAEISIQVNKYYFQDMGAGVIVPILPAALPAALQIPIPIYLLGLTDYLGGYLKSRVVKPVNIWWINQFLIWQPGIPNPIFPLAQIGDLVFVLNAAALGNNFICLIYVHCNNVAYGTFLNSFVSDVIVLNMIRYFVPIANLNQLVNDLTFGYQSLFGKVKTDTVDPQGYLTQNTFQLQIADIPINLPIDKNIFLTTYMEFDCMVLNFILSVAKIQPLTLKPY